MIISAYFADNGTPVIGLTPTINVRDTDNNLVVNGAAMTEIADGFYKYDFAAFDSSKDYVILCDGGTTLVGSERYATGISGDSGSVEDIKAQTDDLPSGVSKNVALSNFQFLMVLSSDRVTPATGKTVVSQISKDGGAFANTINSVVEISNGVYKIDLTQTEMNADMFTLKFTESTCDQRTITIKTSE